MPRLEDYLVLNRYMHHLLGAEDFETLKNLLRPLPEGPGGTGQSHFFARLATQPRLHIDHDRLELYDRRVMAYEERLRKARRNFQGFRYFQYLALLYTEIFLDRLTEEPTAFAADLNRFLGELRAQETDLARFPDFTPEALRRLAFFMATGSGKTLLMHVNIWQVLHYLQYGAHSEALVPGSAPRREFENILLITPKEGLSAQHLVEMQQSGIDAASFIEDPHSRAGLFGPRVKVIEIQKLADEPSRDGVSVVLEEVGPNNLIIVDEGHKGTGSQAQAWKKRQKYLSGGGFLLEYSATFAQAIAAASRRAQRELLQEYGQAILFDYSYAHFHGDGYGKDFTVLNLGASLAEQAHELLVGGMLTFCHQLFLYQQNQATYRRYNIEKPLWVLLGSSVNALYTKNKQRRSDVAEVVAFLKRFVEDREWAVSAIDLILAGDSGFQDAESGQDLFAPHIAHLRGQHADKLYERILKEVFHGSGGLEIWALKQADGEFGLRLSTADESAPYFGVINIGDTSAFKRYLSDRMGIQVQEDNFRPSQFSLVDAPGSPIYLLIGAKKFIEGWSSWRVASMGLLNVGKGAGPQIVQLFGRGVRLKGRGMSLKRSAALRDGQPPEGIRFLETLAIFGWNANYIQTFRQIIDNEDLGKEFTMHVQKMAPWPEGKLPVPQPTPGFDASRLTWMLDDSGPTVELDLTPQIQYLTTATTEEQTTQITDGAGAVYGTDTIDFSQSPYDAAVDLEALYLEALEYKQARGYANLHLTPQAIESALKTRCRLTLPPENRAPASLQAAGGQALKTYMDRFVSMKEREAESQHVEPTYLAADDPRVLDEYRIRVKSDQLLAQIEVLLKNGVAAHDDSEPLPRLYFDNSLFNPLLAEGGRGWKTQVSIHPPALNRDEWQFIKDLREFWRGNHNKASFQHCELYVLRNLARAGLFHRSGFYPDFILWLHHTRTKETQIIFVDPHGLHHGGLAGNADRFAALSALEHLSAQPDFQAKNIRLRGFIMTTTSIAHIPDAGGVSEDELEKRYPLVFQWGEYVAKILVGRRLI